MENMINRLKETYIKAKQRIKQALVEMHILKDKALDESFKETDIDTGYIDGVEIIEDDGVILLTDKSPMKKWKKILIITGSTIAGIVLIVAVIFVSLRISGKSSIYSGATSDKPKLDKTIEISTDKNGATIGEIDIEQEDMGEVIVIGDNKVNNSQNIESNGQDIQAEEETGNKLSFEGAGADSGYDVIYNGEKYVYNKDMITMLVLGVDKLEEVAPAKDGISGGQSDAIFLLVLNPHTMIMDIIAIPRDTIALIDLYNADGSYNFSGYAQICLQHGYGDGMQVSNERTMEAVSNLLYELPIHSVSSFNMGAISYLNDAVGGVTLEVMHDIDRDGYKLYAGQTVTLKGMEAYAYIRYRDITRHYTAAERLARQKQYINLFVDKAIAAIKSDVGTVVDVYNIISDYVVTDLTVDEMTYLASEIVSYRFGEIYTLQGTVDTSRKYERYYLDKDALYELIINKFYEKIE